MPPRVKKIPKWIWEFIEYIDETTNHRNTFHLSTAKKLFEEHYENFQKQKPVKEPEPKPKRDPIASSVGTVVEKLSTMAPQQREKELTEMKSNLKERLEKTFKKQKGSVPVEVCEQIVDSIGEGMMSDKIDRKRHEADEIHRRVKRRITELDINDENIDSGVDTLYNLIIH